VKLPPPVATAETRISASAGRPDGLRLRWLAAWLRRHWLVVVGGASLVGVVVAVDPSKLGSSLESVEIAPLAFMFPVVVSEYAAQGLAWYVLLRRLGVPMNRLQAVEVEIAGQALIFLPAGDLGRVPLVRKAVPVASDAGGIAATIVVQELVFMVILGLAAIPAAVHHPELIGPAASLVGFLGVTAGVLLWRRAFERVLRELDRVPVIRRHDPAIRSLRAGVVHLARPAPLLGSVGWNALGAALGFVLFELALRSVGITDVSPADVALVYAAGHLLAAASMLPGGLGSYEAIVTGFLVLEGVPAYSGAAAALLYRGITDVFMAGFGLAAGAWLRRSEGVRGTHKPPRIRVITAGKPDGTRTSASIHAGTPPLVAGPLAGEGTKQSPARVEGEGW
jgi:uncharacterized membrane protein YbhN (UPF0104 family)